MELGMVLSVVKTLFAALQCSELREVFNILGYVSELEKLERTTKIVKVVLEEAESKEELPPQAQLYVDDLKDAIYDADDLLDEFVTLAQRKEKLIDEGKFSKKIQHLFSRFNPLATAYKMSQGIKEIRKRLDDIANDHIKFGFKLDCQPIRRRREDTCSYVYAPDIIGRRDDQEKIVSMLLNPDVQHVSCLSIVGMGGLGKTALAQLVYNDSRIKEHFPLRLWTCISDQDLTHLDVKATLCKILHSATGKNHDDLAMEPLHRKIRELFEGKTYLLVLDDLWNENRLQWTQLVKFFTTDLKGAWILVTTRSEITATVVDPKNIFMLEGLSKQDSWHLFEMTAFGQRHDQPYPFDLVEIGQDIVKKCANVPLAIKVVGSLLYDQSKEKWLQFHKVELGRLEGGKNDSIAPILKLSYHHLDPPLKTCFGYCAIFPKDRVVITHHLICLWMAQDYIISQEYRSAEDVGREYISILVKRCFFQDVTWDENGDIASFKIHDLMHDVAQEVVGKEIYTANSIEGNFDNRIRHLSYGYKVRGLDNITNSKTRTCLSINGWVRESLPVDKLMKKWMCLRTLDLRGARLSSVPNDLVKLIHLRFLDLSNNYELELLPNSFGELHNLQILRLRSCYNLKELPKDIPELAKLRILDIHYCRALTCMPKGMGKLTFLHYLPLFLVGNKCLSSKRCIVNQMAELKALTNLRRTLDITILGITEYAGENVKEGGYIRHMEHVKLSHITFVSTCLGAIMAENEQRSLLEHLQPHCDLRELGLHH